MDYDPKLHATLRGHRGPISSIAFAPDGRFLATASQDCRLVLWGTEGEDSEQRHVALEGHQDVIHGVHVSPLGNHVVTGSRDRTIRFWKEEAGNQWQNTSVVAHTGAIRCVQVSPDGRQTLSASDDKAIKTWSMETHKFQLSFRGHSNWVRSAAFSPDNQLIVSGGDDRTVKLWDVRSKQCIHTYTEHAGTVMSVGFHPSGLVIAGTGLDKTINLWDCRTHTLLQHYPSAHDNTICSLSFHPTGDFLLTASGDTTLKIWDLREGHLFYTLYGHQQPVNVATFSPDGSSFASGGADNLVLLWHTNFDQLLSDEVDKTADRLLTMDETMHPSHPKFRPSLYQNTPGHTLFQSRASENPVGSPPWLADIGRKPPPKNVSEKDEDHGGKVENGAEEPIFTTDYEPIGVRQPQRLDSDDWLGRKDQRHDNVTGREESGIGSNKGKGGGGVEIGKEETKTTGINAGRSRENDAQSSGGEVREQLVHVVAMLQHISGQMDTLTAVVSSLEGRLTVAEDHILECITRLGCR